MASARTALSAVVERLTRTCGRVLLRASLHSQAPWCWQRPHRETDCEQMAKTEYRCCWHATAAILVAIMNEVGRSETEVGLQRIDRTLQAKSQAFAKKLASLCNPRTVGDHYFVIGLRPSRTSLPKLHALFELPQALPLHLPVSSYSNLSHRRPVPIGLPLQTIARRVFYGHRGALHLVPQCTDGPS